MKIVRVKIIQKDDEFVATTDDLPNGFGVGPTPADAAGMLVFALGVYPKCNPEAPEWLKSGKYEIQVLDNQ